MLANVALHRALADDPRYSMTLLLCQVIDSGAPATTGVDIKISMAHTARTASVGVQPPSWFASHI
jgi:hypothetical protein